MQKAQNAIKINCLLTGPTAQRFDEIKRATGIKNKTEVVRLIINDYFDQHCKEA